MQSRNVFKFVSLRTPEYVPPDPEPTEYYAIVAHFLPDPPDSTVPPEPLPVPMVRDPEAERRFFAGVAPAANDESGDRRRALVERAEEIRQSDTAFGRSAQWQALRPAETALRRLLDAHGPDLALSPDARWVQGISTVVARARPDAADLGSWLDSDDAEQLRGSLWATLYALSVVGGDGTREQGAILFWLRLFAALRMVFATSDPQQSVRIDNIPIGVPNALVSRRSPPPEDPDDETEALEAARRARVAEIDAALEALDRTQADLEELDARLEPVVTGNVYSGQARFQTGSQKARPDISDAEDSAEVPASPRLVAGALTEAAQTILTSEGIRWLGELPDSVDAAIDARLEELENERRELTRRSELVTRGGVLVRRTVQLT